jgi:ABC-type nitrate/sulfonate/bicarbonate transport system ATPase subunit
MSRVAIRIDHVSHVFRPAVGEPFLAVNDVSFDIPTGEFLAVVGPSGCGKTTILNMVAGLIRPTQGDVLLNGKSVAGPDRAIGYMFARDGLLPWRSAQRNVEFGLELRGIARQARRARAGELLELVGLKGFEHAYAFQLSQGMRQRVALARTLAISPSVFLLDEPFAALDAQTKMTLEAEFARVLEQGQRTVMLVTHDLEEAVALADRVIVFSPRPGRIVLDIRVEFSRPRDVQAIRFTSGFRDIARRIWEELKDR